MTWSVEVVESRLFAGVVADEIIASVQDVLSEASICYVGLAGGSTPAETYRLMSHPPRVSDVSWKALRFFMGDERWCKQNETQSNLKMIRETLLSNVPTGMENLYPIDVKLSTPEEAAEKYEKVLRTTITSLDQGIPSLDILLLGVGDDGHIASLFPHSTLISGSGKLCAGVPALGENVARITFTPELIKAAKKTLVLAKGKGKAEIVRRVIEGNDRPEDLPARLLLESRGQVNWFIDSESGQGLSKR